jgi:hypothetical protein
MTLTKFLIFAVIIAALLPAGRETLEELARELLSVTHQPAADLTSDSRSPKRSVR